MDILDSGLRVHGLNAHDFFKQEKRDPRQNIKLARTHRRQFEPEWEMNMAFASGKHWIVYDRQTRSLKRIQDVDPKYRNKELYTSDLINEYRTTVLGELGSDDDRPELLIINQDVTSEQFQKQVNRAVGYGWDNEWDGDSVLAEADRITVDLGTAAIQCRFDPTIGPVRGQMPHVNGKPVHGSDAYDVVSQAVENGDQVAMKAVRGQISWTALSPLNILVPPGITNEKQFPWECVVRPTPIPVVQEMALHNWGVDLSDLTEDGDIKSTFGFSSDTPTTTGAGNVVGDPRQTRLRDHVWLFTYFERPTADYPQGRTFTFAKNNLMLIGYDERLPYVGPNNVYRSGLTYFHWWRVTGRFWSRSLVSSLQDAQFTMDKRRTQMNEIIDRGMPFVFIEKNSQARKRTFLPFEEIEIAPTEKQPQPVQGIGPGPWMAQEVALIREDAEHASGVKATSLGENPANVTTYSQLALIKEADATKRQPIIFARKQSIANLIEDSVYDIRTYWGTEKQIILAGEEGKVEAFQFNASKIPTDFVVKVAKGTPKPRTQAAELQKIQDIAQYSLNSSQPLSVNWYYESIQNGQALPLPDEPSNDQYDKALLENHMMVQGYDVPPTYYDPAEIHIPVHRAAQIKAELTGDVATWQRIEKHVKLHELVAQQNAQKLAAVSAPPAIQEPLTAEQATGASTARGVPTPTPPTPQTGNTNNGSQS